LRDAGKLPLRREGRCPAGADGRDGAADRRVGHGESTEKEGVRTWRIRTLSWFSTLRENGDRDQDRPGQGRYAFMVDQEVEKPLLSGTSPSFQLCCHMKCSQTLSPRR